MPLNQRNVPLPPDDDCNEDVMTSQSPERYLPPHRRGSDESPLPPDPPGREDIMAPDPKDSRASR